MDNMIPLARHRDPSNTEQSARGHSGLLLQELREPIQDVLRERCD